MRQPPKKAAGETREKRPDVCCKGKILIRLRAKMGYRPT
jgi:hypothetical protein